MNGPQRINMNRRTKRANAGQTIAASREATKNMNGTEVVILVRGLYNGPNHKSIGWLNPGDTARVASGGYTDILIRDGLAAMPDSMVDEATFADMVEQMPGEDAGGDNVAEPEVEAGDGVEPTAAARPVRRARRK